MQRRRHLIVSLSLIIITVGFIWMNSALSGADSGALSERAKAIMRAVLDFLHFPENIKAFLLQYVRKVAHVTEYTAIGLELGFLWAGLKKGVQGLWNAFSMVLTIAVLDETIQLLALSRGPQITDVLLDTVSGIAGILLVYFIWIIISCIKYAGE